MRITRPFCEFENQVMRQVSGTSDEIDGIGEDVGIMPSLWSVKPCTTNRAFKEPSSLNVSHNPAHFHQRRR